MRASLKAKAVLFLFLAVCASSAISPGAQAEPYFKLRPLSKIQTGGFFKIGTPADGNVNVGVLTPIVWHDSQDGYLFIKGVDWTLLNAGAIMPTDLDSGMLILGPSISLNEPIKAVVLKGLDFTPGCSGGRCGFLRHILAPVEKGSKDMVLDIGPMWGLDIRNTWDIGKWKGSLLIGTTLSRRFGGASE